MAEVVRVAADFSLVVDDDADADGLTNDAQNPEPPLKSVFVRFVKEQTVVTDPSDPGIAANVGDVLWTTDRAFVCDQRLFAEECDRKAVELSSHFGRERIFTPDAANAGEKIDPIGRASELNDLPRHRASAAVISKSPNPNSLKAPSARSPFSAVGRIQMSRSPVQRGRAWKARLCAPTMRYSTRCEFSNPINSLKSLLRGMG